VPAEYALPELPNKNAVAPSQELAVHLSQQEKFVEGLCSHHSQSLAIADSSSVRFASLADIRAAMELVRFCPTSSRGSPHARNQPVTYARGILCVAGKAFAQCSFFDEDAHRKSTKDQRQNKKTEP